MPSGKEWSWRKPVEVPRARQLSLVEADQSQARDVMDSGDCVGVMKCGGSDLDVGEVGDVGDVEAARKRTRRWPRATAMSNLKVLK